MDLRHAIVFDVDGTLIRSAAEDDALYRRAIENVLGTVRYRASVAEYDHVSDSGILSQVLSDNGVAAEPALVAEIKEVFFAAVAQHIESYGPFEEIPGARGFLDRLRCSEQHCCAIATGGWRESARTKLATTGFELDGVPVATSDDAVDRRDIMQLALDALGSEFASVTYYGDGAWDRDAARTLGWRFRAVGPALGGILTFEHEDPGRGQGD